MKKLMLSLLVIISFSCKKATLDVTPKITYNSMYPQMIVAGATTGSASIAIHFSDGDGDIGFGTNNLFLKDSRDSSTVIFAIPEIPMEYSPNKGITGTILVNYPTALLSLRADTNHLHSDTLCWEIYMKDKAGHISNTIVTDSLILTKP